MERVVLPVNSVVVFAHLLRIAKMGLPGEAELRF